MHIYISVYWLFTFEMRDIILIHVVHGGGCHAAYKSSAKFCDIPRNSVIFRNIPRNSVIFRRSGFPQRPVIGLSPKWRCPCVCPLVNNSSRPVKSQSEFWFLYKYRYITYAARNAKLQPSAVGLLQAGNRLAWCKLIVKIFIHTLDSSCFSLASGLIKGGVGVWKFTNIFVFCPTNFFCNQCF